MPLDREHVITFPRRNHFLWRWQWWRRRRRRKSICRDGRTDERVFTRVKSRTTLCNFSNFPRGFQAGVTIERDRERNCSIFHFELCNKSDSAIFSYCSWVWTVVPNPGLWPFTFALQGDTSPWFKPPVDIKRQVPYWPWPGQAKTELLVWCQQEVWINEMRHPVFWSWKFIPYNHLPFVGISHDCGFLSVMVAS